MFLSEWFLRHECKRAAHHFAIERTNKRQRHFLCVHGFVKKSQQPLFKLISITTDGAQAMVGHANGFIAQCKQSESFPDILDYHCIIHQQALCGKILKKKEVMDVAIKIVCSVQARNLRRRSFSAHLEEAGAEHTDLLLHTDVRWLSRGKLLARFTELLPEIKDFLKLSKHAEYAKLDDHKDIAPRSPVIIIWMPV